MPRTLASLKKLSAEQILALARQQVQEMANRHHLEIGSPQEESTLAQIISCCHFLSLLIHYRGNATGS